MNLFRVLYHRKNQLYVQNQLYVLRIFSIKTCNINHVFVMRFFGVNCCFCDYQIIYFRVIYFYVHIKLNLFECAQESLEGFAH